MADENEYVYRLGLDTRDVRSAINTILSAVGDLDDQFATRTPASIRRTETALAGLLGQMREVSRAGSVAPTLDDRKLLAAERRQQTELAKLVTALRTAEREYDRFLQGKLTGNGGGTGIGAYSSSQLEQFQRTAEVVGGRGSFTRDAAAGQREQVQAVQAQIRAENDVVKALEQEEALERRIAEQVDQTAAARHRAGQQALSDIDKQDAAARQAATAQNQTRLAGSTLGNLTGAGVANGRNSASANGSGTAEQRAAFDQEQAAGLRAYYQAQEKSQAATEAANKAIADEYERHLPRLRYALYDVSTALALGGTASLAAGTAVLGTAADYQSLYAQVRRTSDLLTSSSITGTQKETAFASLRQDLVDLSTQIPVTFQDITTIATLGNQLGIASGNITSFTKTVAQFSATTNVGVDEAATAFGRLGELLNDTDYRKIGDEIAYLGVKSVATESDIIGTASQLAVSGQGIKLTTENVLALATSVASLGVKPEQARGTFIRTFSQIGAAVNEGGAKLNDIARIAGTTSAEFKRQFSAGGDSAYRAFLNFTQGLGTSSAEINANLASIGITAVRDRQTLGLLAQNGTRAFADLSNAAEGANNDFLNVAYDQQAQTVTARLQTLGNQVLALFDDIGQSSTGPIAVGLQVLQKFVNVLDVIARVPAAGSMLAIGAAVAVVAGALAIAIAGGLRAYAVYLALQSVLIETGVAGTGLVGVLGAMATRLAQVAAETVGLTAAQQGLAASNAEVAATGAAANGSLGGVTGTAGRTAGAVSKLSGVLGKAGLYGGLASLLLMLPSISEGLQGIISDLKGATPEVDDLTRAVNGLSAAGADKAMQTLLNGTQAFGKAEQTTTSSDGRRGSIVNRPLTGPVFQEGTPISAGQGAINRIRVGQDTLKGQNLAPNADVSTAVTEIKNYDAALNSLLSSGNQAGFNKLLGIYHEQMKQAGVSTRDADSALTQTVEATGTARGGLVKFTKAQQDATQATDDGTDATTAFSSALDGIFGQNIGAFAVTSDLQDLGQQAVESGAQVAFGGSAMQKTIEDIYASSDDTTVVKGRLQSLYDGLVKLGYAKSALQGLAQAIATIPGKAAPAALNLDGFTSSVDDARKKSDSAAASVRQLSDYAGDLSTAFQRATEIRFGNGIATDALTKGFQDLRSSIKDSRDELKKAKADLAELNSDQTVRQYQLGIATKFGDTERAAVLRADIAKGQADIDSKRQDVQNAQTSASRALVGNSEGAIANRGKFRDLISNGQDVLTTMAKNGASQKDLEATAEKLKRQLIDQGTQMGFRRKDLEQLAKAYDDYAKIIDGVPKNLTTTVKANTSPGAKALAEYREKLDQIDGKTVTTHVVQQAISLADPLQTPAGGLTTAQRAQSIDDARASRGFRSGGYTGSAPRWQEAGAVHGDEFVLNSQGYRMFPRQMLEAANHGVAPQQLRVQATASLPSGATVSLSREDRAIMAAGGGSQSVQVNADRFGSAMDASFARQSRRGEN